MLLVKIDEVNKHKSKNMKPHNVAHLVKTAFRRCLLHLVRSNKIRDHVAFDDEVHDNIANEILENEIFEEIDRCGEGAGVEVYLEDGSVEVAPVARGQRYVPVHFARTEAGTFFWTSVGGGGGEPDGDVVYRKAVCGYQRPEVQVDRWAQA